MTALAIQSTHALPTSLVDTRLLSFSYCIMIGAWALDFRSEGAGQGLAVQSVFLVIYALATCGLYLNHRGAFSAGMRPLFYACALFLLVAIPISLLREQDGYGVFRQVSTVLIYLSASHATAVLIGRFANDLQGVRRMIAWLCLLYLLSNLAVVGFGNGGIAIGSARYEVIGTSVAVAVSYLVLYLRSPLSRVELTTALLGVSIVALSATRTWLAVAAVQVAVALLLNGLNARTVKRVAAIAALGIVALGALELGGVPVIERWTQRLLISSSFGVDPTGLSRQRQADSMLASIEEDPWVGAGLQGQSSYWLEPGLGGDQGIEHEYGFGHNQHLALLFIAGAIGGGPLLAVQVLQGVSGAVFIWRRRWRPRSNLTFLGSLGALTVIGTLVYGLLGGTFASRGLSLWYGVGTGLMIGCIDLASSTGKRRSRRRALAL